MSDDVLELQASVISRIIKNSLGETNSGIAKDARLAVAKAARVFVTCLTTTANDHAAKKNHKTIAAQDVFDALEDMELPDFVEQLKGGFEEFQEALQAKRVAASEARKKKIAEKKAEKDASSEGAAVAASTSEVPTQE